MDQMKPNQSGKLCWFSCSIMANQTYPAPLAADRSHQGTQGKQLGCLPVLPHLLGSLDWSVGNPWMPIVGGGAALTFQPATRDPLPRALPTRPTRPTRNSWWWHGSLFKIYYFSPSFYFMTVASLNVWETSLHFAEPIVKKGQR